jgi:uncharacterized phage-associated protein
MRYLTEPLAVANEFIALWLSDTTPGLPPVDRLKLGALIFYAYAWYAANEDEPLFEESIVAAPFGPIVQSIHTRLKRYGLHPVTEMLRGPTGYSSQKAPTIEDSGLEVFLEQVWENYKHLTGIQLCNSTHDLGEPWSLMLEKYGNLEHTPVIHHCLIREVFKKKILHGS